MLIDLHRFRDLLLNVAVALAIAILVLTRQRPVATGRAAGRGFWGAPSHM